MLKSSLLRRCSAPAANSTTTINVASAFPLGSSSSLRVPPLPLDAITSFRQKGYLVLGPGTLFTPQQLSLYEQAVRSATERRGKELIFPNANGSVQDLEVHVQGRVQQGGDPDKAQKQTKAPVSRVNVYARSEKQARRIAMGVKNKTRKRYGDRAVTYAEQREAALKKGEDAAAKAARGETGEDGAANNNKNNGGSDPMDLNDPSNNMTSEELERLHDEYVRSDVFQRDVVRKARIREVTRYFEMIHRPWMHLWHGDPQLAALFCQWREGSGAAAAVTASGENNIGNKSNDGGVVDPASIGRALGRLACEAVGCARARLFTDRAQYRCAWGNAHALHCEQAFVDFNDHRGALVTTVFGESDCRHSTSTRAFDRDTGGFFVLDGSHHVMRRVTLDAADASVYKAAPTAWDFGEIARRNKREFRRCTPTHLSLAPGSVVIMSSQLVWGHVPNYSGTEVLSHTATLMPDGCLYNGQRHSWLSRDEEGPLHEYTEGDPLNDDALFPMLYSIVDGL